MADTADVAVLGIRIDTSGVDQAKKNLDSLTASAVNAEVATGKLNAAQAAQGSSASKIADAYKSTSTSHDAYLRSLAAEYDSLGKTRAEIVSREASLSKLSNAEQAHAATLGKAIDAYHAEEAAAKALARSQDASATAVNRSLAALEQKALYAAKGAQAGQLEVLASKGASVAEVERARGLLATIDAHEKATKATNAHGAALDGFSLKSSVAKRELITLFREAGRGDFTRLAGSFSLFAQASGLAGIAASGAGIAIIGTTLAVAGLAVAAAFGEHEQRRLQNALLLTNNAAGLTEDGIHSLAESILQGLSGGTIRTAEKTLEGLVASGRLTGEALQSAGKASLAFQLATGESTEKANQFLLKAADDVTKFATSTNQQYHYLSAEQLRYIKVLQETGEAQQALKIVFDAFEGTAAKAAENIGSIERAWNAAKRAASGYLDAISNIGKTPTTGKALQNAEADLKQLLALKATIESGAGGGAGEVGSIAPSDAEIAHARTLVDNLRDVKEQEGQIAKAKGDQVAKDTARTGLDKLHDQFLERSVKREREIADAKALALKADPTGQDAGVQKTLSQTIAGIRERFKDRKTSGAITEQDLVKIDVAKVQAQFKVVEDGFKNFDRIAHAERQAGLIDERDFAAQREVLIKAEANVAVESLERQNAIYRKGIDTRKTTAKQAIEDEKQIQLNREKIVDIQDKERTSLAVLQIESHSYLISVAEGYMRARQEAQNYLDVLTRTNQRTLAVQPLGQREAARVSGRNQIADAYDDRQRARDEERDRRQASGTFTRSDKEQYDVLTAQGKEFRAKALAEWDDYYTKLIQADDNWKNGASRALQNYMDQAGFTAKNAEGVFTNALKGMEDALVTFATTGKLSFKSLIDSFVADIIRLTIQQELIKPIASYLNGEVSSSGGGSGSTVGLVAKGIGFLAGLFGGGGTGAINASGSGSYASLAGISGGRAAGGPVAPGQLLQVNENKPELLNVAGKQYLMMGSNNGGSVSNAAAQSGERSVMVTVNQSFAPGTDRRTTDQAAAQAASVLRRAGRVT